MGLLGLAFSSRNNRECSPSANARQLGSGPAQDLTVDPAGAQPRKPAISGHRGSNRAPLVVCREKARIDHSLAAVGLARTFEKARSRSKYGTAFKGAKGACLKTLWGADRFGWACTPHISLGLSAVGPRWRTTTRDFRRTQRAQPTNDLPLFFRWVLGGGSPSCSQTRGVGAPCLCWPRTATQEHSTASYQHEPDVGTHNKDEHTDTRSTPAGAEEPAFGHTRQG